MHGEGVGEIVALPHKGYLFIWDFKLSNLVGKLDEYYFGILSKIKEKKYTKK